MTPNRSCEMSITMTSNKLAAIPLMTSDPKIYTSRSVWVIKHAAEVNQSLKSEHFNRS